MPPCLMAYYCLLWHRSTGNAPVLLALSSILHIQGFFCKSFTLHRKGNTSMPSTLVTLNMLRQMHTKGIKFNRRKCMCLSEEYW